MSLSKVYVALDYPDSHQADALVRRLSPDLCGLKVGSELFTACGPDVIQTWIAKGFSLFLDLKYHDIPNTVAKSCQAAAQLGVDMLTLHIAGGRDMMAAAVNTVNQFPVSSRPLLLGVTVLTSLLDDDLHALGWTGSVSEYVAHYASIAKGVGLDGVVCSGCEVNVLRQMLGRDYKLVTPGISLGAIVGLDQKRCVTPSEAVEAGADILVIGRAITQADDPLDALQEALDQIALCLV